MNTFDAIRERRAVKSFDPTHQFTKQETEQLLDLAMQAPSSFNIQHWRLVNVTDKALRAQLREAAFDQAQVTEASLLFVVTVDIKAWEKDPARYWVNAPKEAQDILVPWINPFYSGNEQLQRDEAMRSAGIMLQRWLLSDPPCAPSLKEKKQKREWRMKQLQQEQQASLLKLFLFCPVISSTPPNGV